MGHSMRPADDLKIEIYRVMPMSADSTKPMKNEAIVATNLTKWFGEGEARMTAVNDVALVAFVGGTVKAIWHFDLVNQNGSLTYLNK